MRCCTGLYQVCMDNKELLFGMVGSIGGRHIGSEPHIFKIPFKIPDIPDYHIHTLVSAVESPLRIGGVHPGGQLRSTYSHRWP